MRKFLNVGHRGAAAYAPENTIASLEEAILLRADMLEFDLRKTADGILVLCHDPVIKTARGVHSAISKMSFKELDIATKAQGYEVATFEEVLKIFGPRIPLNIEVKLGGFEHQIVEFLRRYPPAFEPTISSFYPWIMARIKLIDKNLRTALIVGQDSVRRINILARPIIERIISILRLDAVHIQESIVSSTMVEYLKQADVAVLVWTVDDPEQMRKLIGNNVDGIITNKPDILYEVCFELTKSERPPLKTISDAFGRFAYSV